jgi:hypothetical protein
MGKPRTITQDELDAFRRVLLNHRYRKFIGIALLLSAGIFSLDLASLRSGIFAAFFYLPVSFVCFLATYFLYRRDPAFRLTSSSGSEKAIIIPVFYLRTLQAQPKFKARFYKSLLIISVAPLYFIIHTLPYLIESGVSHPPMTLIGAIFALGICGAVIFGFLHWLHSGKQKSPGYTILFRDTLTILGQYGTVIESLSTLEMRVKGLGIVQYGDDETTLHGYRFITPVAEGQLVISVPDEHNEVFNVELLRNHARSSSSAA